MAKIRELKENGKIDSVSSFLQDLVDDHFKRENKGMFKDVMIFIFYPLIISFLLFMWGKYQIIVIGSGDFTFNLLYVLNLFPVGFALASCYYLFDKFRKNK